MGTGRGMNDLGERSRSNWSDGAAGPARRTYSVDEVAQVLGLSRSKTYELVAQGAIPVVPLAGRRKLIARVTVERLLAGEEPSRGSFGAPA